MDADGQISRRAWLTGRHCNEVARRIALSIVLTGAGVLQCSHWGLALSFLLPPCPGQGWAMLVRGHGGSCCLGLVDIAAAWDVAIPWGKESVRSVRHHSLAMNVWTKQRK